MLTFLNNLSRTQQILIFVVIIGLIFYCQSPSESKPEIKENFLQQQEYTIDHNTHRFSSPKEHIPDGKYLIIGSRNDRICRDSPNGVICNSDFPSADDFFTIQNADPAKKMYFIKGGRSDNWCGLTAAGVNCNQFMTDDYSLFRIEPLKKKGKYGIKNVITDMWCSESGYGLVCKANKLYGTDFEEFTFIPVREPNIR